MSRLGICLWLFAALLGYGVAAAESDATTSAAPAAREYSMPGGSGRGGSGGPDGPGGGRMDFRRRFSEINETLQEKFPEEFAEMEALRETDRRAAMEKFRELAQKAGIEMPSFGGRRGRDGERRGGPERGAFEEEIMPQMTMRSVLELMKQKFPDEFDENGNLKETDPAAALEKWRMMAEQTEIPLFAGEADSSAAKLTESPRNRHALMMMRADRLLAERDPENFIRLTALRSEDPDAARELFREMLKRAELTVEILSSPLPGEKPVRQILIELPSSEDEDNSSSSRFGNFRPGGFGGPPDGGPAADGAAPPPPPPGGAGQ